MVRVETHHGILAGRRFIAGPTAGDLPHDGSAVVAGGGQALRVEVDGDAHRRLAGRRDEQAGIRWECSGEPPLTAAQLPQGCTAAAAAFVTFYWLDAPTTITTGITVFGVLKATVPALLIALAQEAARAGIEYFSLTDHDTTDGWREMAPALELAERMLLELRQSKLQ